MMCDFTPSVPHSGARLIVFSFACFDPSGARANRTMIRLDWLACLIVVRPQRNHLDLVGRTLAECETDILDDVASFADPFIGRT